MTAALNRFISKSSDKCLAFFQVHRKNSKFEWNVGCDKALVELKKYISLVPLLTTPEEGQPLFVYLAIFEQVVSSVLIREKEGEQK